MSRIQNRSRLLPENSIAKRSFGSTRIGENAPVSLRRKLEFWFASRTDEEQQAGVPQANIARESVRRRFDARFLFGKLLASARIRNDGAFRNAPEGAKNTVFL